MGLANYSSPVYYNGDLSFYRRSMGMIEIGIALLAGIGIGRFLGNIKDDQLIGFHHFNIWEQAKSKKLHITPRAGGKLGIEHADKDGILIVLEKTKNK